jgi:hypothetical protein
LIIASGCYPSQQFWCPINSAFAYSYGLRGATQSSPGREYSAGGSAVVPTMIEGLEIELSDFKVEDSTVKGDYLLQVFEN